MAKSPHYKGNNEGGFGNPPIDHQFNGKPGPGRPKGSKNGIDAALRKAYSEPIEVVDKETKKRRMIDPNLAIAKRSVQLGMSGRSHDNARAIELARRFGPESESNQRVELDLTCLSDFELDLYGLLAARLENVPFTKFEADWSKEISQTAATIVRLGRSLGRDVDALQEFIGMSDDG